MGRQLQLISGNLKYHTKMYREGATGNAGMSCLAHLQMSADNSADKLDPSQSLSVHRDVSIS